MNYAAKNKAPAFALWDWMWLKTIVAETVATGELRQLHELSTLADPPPAVLGNLSSLLVLPLTVQGERCGALVLASRRLNYDYQVKDINLARDLAYRAGLALENVMLVERISEADRRKDEFLGMLAHELRNPLGPIYNSLQLQKMLGSTHPRWPDLHDIIDRQAKHMGRLIDDLLDATRLAHGKFFCARNAAI